MPTKAKPTSRTKSGSKPKSKISNKLIAAIIVGVVAIAGIAIIFNSFASTLPAYTYSFYTSCLSDKKSTTVKSDIGNYNVTVPWDTKSNCLKDSAEEQAYRLNRAVTNGQPPNPPTDYNKYKELVQKMAGDRVPVPELVPQSFLDQFKDKSDAEFVTQVFKNVLYRTPGDNGASWAADMKKNGWSRKDAVFIISSSPEAKNKNVGRFSEFLRNNPNPVNINPVAQNAQNARDAEVSKILDPGMKAANFRIIQLRNEINGAATYAIAKPKQDEVSRIMIDLGKSMENVNVIYNKSLAESRIRGIAIARIDELKKQADGYIASSWAATLDAGKKAEDLNLKEYYTKVQAQQVQAARAANARNVGTPGRGSSTGGSSSTGGGSTGGGGGKTALTDDQVRFLLALNGVNTGSPSKYDRKPPKKAPKIQEPRSGLPTLWAKLTCSRGECQDKPWWTNKTDQRKAKDRKFSGCQYNYNPKTGKCTR